MAIDFTDTVTQREVVLQRLFIHIGKALSMCDLEASRFELYQHMDDFFRIMAYDLKMYVAGDHVVTDVVYVRYPASWWEAFKARWFSDWMVRRWPVRQTEKKIAAQTITRMCPHLPIDPKEKHLRWFIGEVQREL